MMWFWLSVAFADEVQESDIVVEAELAVAADALYAGLQDLTFLQRVYPEACVQDWVLGPSTSGVGARAMVTYRAAKMKRRLGMTVKEAKTGIGEGGATSVVDLDHPGDKGFVTRWTVVATEAGADVNLHTFVNAPKWPLRKYYFAQVQPAWRACYEEALQRIPAALQGG